MNNRGSALMLVIIFVFVMTTVGMATIYLNNSEEITARQEIDKVRALYLAEAGVERARAWLVNSGSYPENTYGVTPFRPFGGEVVLEPEPSSSQGSYLVSIDPYDTNMSTYVKTYLIVSTGTAGSVLKVVKATVELSNMMKYVYFSEFENNTDVTSSMKDYDRIFITSADEFEGLVHSNDAISVSGGPKFSTTQSASYFDVSTADEFYYFSGYAAEQSKYRSAGPSIPMFNQFNLEPLANAAAQSGLSLTGNYVGVDKIVLFNTYLTYGTQTYNIPPGGGVVFVKGNVEIKSNVSGSPSVYTGLQRWLTVVASGTASSVGKIEVVSDIRYGAGTGGDPKGCLGLVASSNVVVGAGASRLDGLIFTKGSLVYDKWSDTGTVNVLALNGGMVQRYRKPLGQIPGSPYATTLTSGLSKKYVYDDRLRYTVPPYFPATKMARRVSWSEEAVKRK